MPEEIEQGGGQQPNDAPRPQPRLAGSTNTRHKREPTLGFLYSIEISGGPLGLFPVPFQGYFTEVSGLAVEYEVIEFKTTNVLGLARRNQYPGRPVYSPITLRRGVTGGEGFWLWHQLLQFGLKSWVLSASVSINIYDRNYKYLAAFTVERAWPSKVSGIEVRADSNDVLVEELVLQHGGVSRDLFSGDAAILNGVMQAIAS